MLVDERHSGPRGRKRHRGLPSARDAALACYLDGLERLLALRGNNHRTGEGHTVQAGRILIVGDRLAGGIVGCPCQSIESWIGIGDGDAVGRSRPQRFRQPAEVEVSGIHAGCPDRPIPFQFALEGQRPFVGLRLRLVRIDERIRHTGDRPEVAAVWIEVDLPGLIFLVAVQIVPGPRR